MTVFDDAYDALHSVITTLFPDRKELIEPSLPELNDELHEKCFGIIVGPTFNTNRFVGCDYSVSTDFIVVLTQRAYAGDIRTNKNFEEKRNKTKQLFSDRLNLIKAVETSTELNSNNDIVKAIFVSDGGREFIQTEKTNLYSVQIVFNIEYFDKLTT